MVSRFVGKEGAKELLIGVLVSGMLCLALAFEGSLFWLIHMELQRSPWLVARFFGGSLEKCFGPKGKDEDNGFFSRQGPIC